MTDSQQIDGRQIKILVVDDEEIVLSLARDALEDAGYLIELAGGGDEALDKVEKEYFDFILTDIRMPGCNGLELARKAREIIPSVGIIFMTGYANLDTAKDAIKEGAYDFILKPFELNELRQAVKNAVGKKQKYAEKTLSSELDRLSSLNQLMYTVSDRKSLMRLSLGFAMMQGRAKRGKIIYKIGNENEIGIVSTDNLVENNFLESIEKVDIDYFDVNASSLNIVPVLQSVKDHSLVKKFNDPRIESYLTPPQYEEGDSLVSMPLTRGDNLYGFLVLGYSGNSNEIKESELKLLSITVSQIAISLENIIFLEESRDSYSRLKDLQDQTLQLERMAAKGQMSAEIGHELNNYLGVVTGNLSLMEHHLKNQNYGELEKYLDVVNNNLDKIKEFTEGLVDVSKLKSKFDDCDINNLVGEVIEYLKAQKRFADVSIIFNQPKSHIFTQADSGQLQQLLYNLLNNAADALTEVTVKRKKRIEIGISHEATENLFRIAIADNGCGFSDETMEKAFKTRFTTKKSGHGFGLLVCEKIIEHHSGKLHLDSTPNEGTKITLEFPINKLAKEPLAV